jgi:outer membrane protein TolC
VASTKSAAIAEEETSAATTAQIVLAVDQVFYSALEARALLQVAQQTIDARQLIANKISALTQAKLKSDLDLSFANVDLAKAKLLQLQAKNNYAASLATLSAILSYPDEQQVTAAEKFGRAEHDLWKPTVSALALKVVPPLRQAMNRTTLSPCQIRPAFSSD